MTETRPQASEAYAKDVLKIPGIDCKKLQAYARLIGANPYIPVVPTVKQLAFIAAPQMEKGYGGAAGGGKTIAALVDSLLPTTQRNFNALILRRTFSQLSQPDAIMDVAKSWIRPTDARWNERDKVIYFPRTGAKVQFGFMEREDDKHRYQSAQFQRIHFEEATQFPWSQYAYLRSRARRSIRTKVAPTIGAETNPGNIGHQWFYSWFVKGEDPSRIFIPALMRDNKYLDEREYKRMLRGLSPIERAQLEEGRWVTDDSGKPFKAEYWEDANRYIPGMAYADVHSRYIFCDTALKNKKDSAYTAILVMELLKDYRVRVRYVFREKLTLPEIVRKLTRMGERWNADGKLWKIILEDKASGPSVVQTFEEGADEFMRSVIDAYWYQGSKEEKWQQAALWCWRDCVELPYHLQVADLQSGEQVIDWLMPFEEEIFAVPEAEYYDQADVLTLAILYLEELIAWGFRDRQRYEEELRLLEERGIA